MSARARALALLVLLLTAAGVVLSIGSAPAKAQTAAPPPVADVGWWARQSEGTRQIINNWAYKPSGHPPPYNIETDLPNGMFRDEMDELGARRDAQRLEANRLRVKAGLLRGVGTALNRFSLVVGAFSTGWAIGEGINRLANEVLHGGPAPAGSQVCCQAMQHFGPTQGLPFTAPGINRVTDLPGVGAGEGAWIFQYTSGGQQFSVIRPEQAAAYRPERPPNTREYEYLDTTDPVGYQQRRVHFRSEADMVPRTFPAAPGAFPQTDGFPTLAPRPLSDAGADVQARSDRLGQELEKAENQNIRKWAEAQTGQPGAEDPYAPNSTVPGYGGYVWETYRQKLLDLGFTDINRIIVPDGGANVELGANAVLNTSPAPGTSIQKESRINVETNPATLPLVVPAPFANEVYSKYLERLDPSLRERVVEDVAVDPNLNVGPDVVLSTEPAPGAQVRPESDPAFRLRVRRNPSSAPVPGGAGGACGLTPPVSALNFSPITNAQLGNKIPFSLVGFLGGASAGLVTGSERPNAGFSVLGVGGNLGMLGDLDPAIGMFRLALAFLLWLGVAWFLYGRTIGRD
jgi:hypothetical protein